VDGAPQANSALLVLLLDQITLLFVKERHGSTTNASNAKCLPIAKLATQEVLIVSGVVLKMLAID